jgi:hypothetical protein
VIWDWGVHFVFLARIEIWFRREWSGGQDGRESGGGDKSRLEAIDRHFVVPSVVIKQEMLVFLRQNAERAIVRALEWSFNGVVPNVDVRARI